MTARSSAAAEALPVGSPSPSSPLLFKTDREKFFAILTHDDRNSRYVVSTDASGSWEDISLDAASLSSWRLDPRANCYVTRNGFAGSRRLDARVRQLNSIFLDVDFHDIAQAGRDALVAEVLQRVESAVAGGFFPRPTMVVNSGRGVHLYYVLHRSVPCRVGCGVNEQGISYFSHVQRQLADVLDGILSGIAGAKVDRVVFDFARVSRIPDTYNAKAGRYARLISAGETYYNLPELDSYKPLSPEARAPEPKRGGGFRIKFDRLLLSRLAKVAELQEHRGFKCEGNRELMSFVYYNTAVQVYGEDGAWERLLQFNARFTEPLPESELQGIRSAVSSVVNVKGERGYYVLSAATVARMLSITEDEAAELGFFESRRTLERTEAKRRTAERRHARDERIIAMRKEGRAKRDIADELGISLGTVHNVLKAAGLTRTNGKAKEERRSPLRHVERGSLRCKVGIASAEGTFPGDFGKEPSVASPESTNFWRTGYGVVPSGKPKPSNSRGATASPEHLRLEKQQKPRVRGRISEDGASDLMRRALERISPGQSVAVFEEEKGEHLCSPLVRVRACREGSRFRP